MARAYQSDDPYQPTNRYVRQAQVNQLAPADQQENPYAAWQDSEKSLYDASTSGANAPDPYAPALDTTGWHTDNYATPAYVAPKAAGTAMAGWDQTKWADTTHQTPKYAIGRILSQYSPTVEGLGQAITEIQQAYPGVKFDGKDKLIFPDGSVVDVLQGASQGGSAWQWGAYTDANGNPTGFGGLGTAGTGTGTGLSMGALPLGRTTTETDPFYQSQRAAVLKYLGQDPTAVTADSPGVKGSVDAYRAEAERARRARLRAEMEQLGASGLSDSGASGSALAQGYEDMGTNVANYAANAVVQEMSAQRQEVAQALQLATQMGMTQEAQDLQRQLANLDAAIRQQAMSLQNTQFNDSLGWQMAQYQMNYPLNYYQMLLNG